LEQENYNFSFTLKSIASISSKKYIKVSDIFCLLHECTYVELNKICFVIVLIFFINYYTFINFQPI